MAPQFILIGPPGAGKSTVGQALAERIKTSFSDTDSIIESQCEKSISSIFLEDGEEFFRKIELNTLLDLLEREGGVLALGGGAPLSERAQRALKKSTAHIVNLEISLATVASRVGFNRDRPLLIGNPRGQWQALMEKRRPVYLDLADVTINVDELGTQDIVEKILDTFL